MEGIGLIIIIIVIIGIIISLTKKKAPEKPYGEDGSEYPRSAALSDIQKAFMLVNDFDESEQTWSNQGPDSGNPSFEDTSSARRIDHYNTDTHLQSSPVNIDESYSSFERVGYQTEPIMRTDSESDTYDSRPAARADGIKFLENQNEYVKAIIYSEILANKTRKRT
ncbi:MAG: hypothetical protein ACOX8Q_00850 [Christensenellales bacterium]|jgi:hypothetical protein